MKSYIGLDLGVKNTGYAFTDENYIVKTVKGKRAMGVLSYPEGEVAVARRTYRATRRRMDRRRERINLCQEIFNDPIMSVDQNFLRRLNENDLHKEDRKTEGKYSLFNDKDFTDVQYYKKYPTIYHLRKDLMENGTDDIRLLYLAVHHIIKYRGNFLLPGDLGGNVAGVKVLEDLLEQLTDYKTNEQEEKRRLFDYANLEQIKDLICDRGEIVEQMKANLTDGKKYISKKDKKAKVKELLISRENIKKEQKDFVNSVVDIMFSGEVKLTNLFGKDENGEYSYPKEDINGFEFADGWENAEDMLLIKDDDRMVVECIKGIYDWALLNELLHGEDNISTAMVGIYKKHKKDLQDLKKLIKTYAPEQYQLVFGAPEKSKSSEEDEEKSTDKKNNKSYYTAYIGGGRYDHGKVGNNGRIGATASQEAFYKDIKKIIEGINAPEAEQLKESILLEIENGTFLPKITSKNNSTLPYQLNKMELVKILDKASENPKFSFLLDVSDGLTNKDKLVKLLEFRVLYYVGPLNRRSDFAWMERKEEGKITPWNFEQKIDSSKSNQEFIRRMTNKCTYLKDADTLPKNSILYSKYMCLNELNNIKVNGVKLSPETKKEIFKGLYLTRKNPTISKMKKYIIDNQLCDSGNPLISGVEQLVANMNTYCSYKSVLGDKVDSQREMVERIIFLSTIHNDSTMLEKSVIDENELNHWGLSEKEIKSIKGYKWNGWGKFSAEFLAGYKHDGIRLQYDGEFVDIIDIMENTDSNLQQIISSDKCNVKEALAEYNKEHNIGQMEKFDYESVMEDCYASPSVKKCVWQAFRLVKDLIKQTKCIPDVVFLESCRTNDDKKKGQLTKSRYDMIAEVYKEAKSIAKSKAKDMCGAIDTCTNTLEKYKGSNELKAEKLYLYFMQLGRDMYSGEAIDLDNLMSANSRYDVDHIIPKAKIKDDSLTNKVLVNKPDNGEKDKNYPLDNKFRQEVLWKKLYDLKLISEDKYSRLTRKTPFSPEEQEKFINRQLVETNQTVLLLRDILESYFAAIADKKVEIVLSRAGNVSMFRKEYGLTKSREVNDFHHAADAYLNIVVGDILNREYSHNWMRDRQTSTDKSYNFLTTLQKKAGANDKELLRVINGELESKNCQMVKLVSEQDGSFYGEQLKSAEKEGSALIPMCESKIVDGVEQNPKCDTTKYGGYKTANTSHFVIADSKDKKGNLKRSFISISILDKARLKNGYTTYEQIFADRGLIDGRLADIPGLREPAIKVGTLMEFTKYDGEKVINRYKLRLSGISGNYLLFHNANQLFVSKEQNDYIKEISLVVDKVAKETKANKNIDTAQYAQELIDTNIARKANPENKNKNIIIINPQENIKMYDFFARKLSEAPYRDIPTYDSLLNILTKAKDSFVKHDIYDQMTLLLNIIKAFQCNALKVDVSKLTYLAMNSKKKKEEIKKGGTNQCAIARNIDITEEKELYMICQSVSGLREKRIKLSK